MWNLNDLYPGMKSKEFAEDFKTAPKKSAAFEVEYKGKLSSLLDESGDKLAQSIIDYEKLEEELGRIISYAGLIYAGDSTNPENAKILR